MIDQLKEFLNRKIPINTKTLIIIIVGLWFAIALINILIIGGINDAGSFGDSFGSLNTLFSGLALAGIVYTILLQRKDLNDQKDFHIDQKRLQNLPFFRIRSFKDKDQNEFISIKNKSINPCFSLKIHKAIYLNNNETNDKKERLVKFLIKPEFVNQELSKLIKDDGTYAFIEESMYPNFTPNEKITIPVNEPFDGKKIAILLDYNDTIGNQYIQLFDFELSSFEETPLVIKKITPNVPKIVKSFYISNTKDENDISEEIRNFQFIFNNGVKVKNMNGDESFYKNQRWQVD